MEWFEMQVPELVDAMKRRKVGVEEVTGMFLKRIATDAGPQGLNAVGEISEDALAQARRLDAQKDKDGALFGLPILVKDNIDVKGLHTTAGSPALAGHRACAHAPVIEGLCQSGAVILGKTHMTEFANYTTQDMPNGFSALGGQVKHAYNPLADPSGSSTGSAVAVSAGLCAAAVGTDTSFSIVGCATVHGVTGYKPPVGKLSGRGIVPIARTLDSAGPLTRGILGAIWMYEAMGGRLGKVVPKAPGEIRLAVNTYHQEDISSTQTGYYEALIKALTGDGCRIDSVEHPYCPGQRDIMRCEFRRDLEDYLAKSSAKMTNLQHIVALYEDHPQYRPYGITCLKAALEAGPEEEAYRQAMEERQRVKARLTEQLKAYDACLMTGPTNVMHFAGLPSLALPLGMGEDGMPRGMILYGADEERLLSAALTLERYSEPVPMAPMKH